ncbi:mechanosensitive ion channel family protein [Candidatus Dactylopiibacterium carminicum]|nr:mechanosensitive ion channel family protein [Candidatus Dactylopiibacterium carminicum]
MEQLAAQLAENPLLYTLIALSLLLSLSWLGNWIVKRILLVALFRALRASPLGEVRQGDDLDFIARLANVVPALIISEGILYVPGLPEALVTVVSNVSRAFTVVTVAMAISHVLTLVNQLYERRPDAQNKPIKGYLQLLKLVVYVVATILMVALLLDRSPLILLSGLGAMAAVLMLIFQDTLLSLVASVQISSNDIIRVGDWVEMPQLNADGSVIDVALHTVKVQNWDKTITTIPTRRFITDPFKNWRGMQESGGRRIKRSLMIDQQSVRFLDEGEKTSLRRFRLLQDYLEQKQQEIEGWNARLQEQGRETVNTRRITNLGTFRAYVERYLRHHTQIHQDMTLIVRQMAPTPEGLPLEIYCFTATTAWVAYEGIQADIFDHLLAIIPEFGLRLFQQPSGQDMRTLARGLHAAEAA